MSHSETLDYQVLLHEFTGLRKGGAKNNFLVNSIVFQFKRSPKNCSIKITEIYTQQYNKALSITEARYIGDFAIRLFFNDGHQILVDFKPFLENAVHPSIRKYLNEDQFKRYQLVNGNLDWNDFDLCFPIQDLYDNQLLKQPSVSAAAI